VGSLSGALTSQIVTEVFKGWLGSDGNRADSAKAKASFTARPISRAVAKAGFSDPMVACRRAKAQQIKVTPGITEWYPPIAHIDGGVRYLDVGSSHPGAGEGAKGLAVRQLKWYASWVQTVNITAACRRKAT